VASIPLVGVDQAPLLAERVVLAAGVAFGLAAMAVVLVLGKEANWFGARGSNVSLLLGASVGLILLAVAPQATASRP
jgi:hypothetical protein